MVSVYTLGQLSCPWAATTQNPFAIRHPMASNNPSCIFDQFQYTASKSATNPDTPTYRQWPWRGFAFCSDLGTVGYLVNKPKLGILGWALALPYYGYALLKQPKGKQRNQELLYQTTGNGIFPFIEAKGGVVLGGLLHQKILAPLIKKSPTSALNRLTLPTSKITGGIMALLALTPTVGDPISHWILKQYKTHLKKEQPE